MLRLSKVLAEHTHLNADDRAWLLSLVREWHLLADTSFSDLVLWLPDDKDENVFWAGAQIRPTTGPTALEDEVIGAVISYDHESLVTCAWLSRDICETSDNRLQAGIPVDVMAIPIVRHDDVIAILERHTNRMGVRAPGALEDTYLAVADTLSDMLLHGEFPIEPPSDPTTSPRAGDGLMWIDTDGTVTYASPNAVSCLRRLGFAGDLVGDDVRHLAPALADEFSRELQAAQTSNPSRIVWEVTVEEPQASVRMRVVPLVRHGEWVATVALCRDVTALRERERQLVTKDATIREIHHRVKNNLQTVAALLRLQARRTTSPEASGALSDAQKRVAAIAVVHEILSQAFDASVKFDDVADRLLRMVVDVAATGGPVQLRREGSFGYVPADVATSLSLVLTELCQNAIEHGFGEARGVVWVRPEQADGRLVVEVTNQGAPLPEGFSVETSHSLGLSIVTTLVDDLNGEFSLTTRKSDGVTVARVSIPLG